MGLPTFLLFKELFQYLLLEYLKQVVQNVNAVGDVDVRVVVGIRSVSTRWSLSTQKQEAEDADAVGDVDAVGVAPLEVVFGDPRYDPPAALKGVLVLPEAALDRVVVGPGHVEREGLLEP